jgi:hypothetical protein
LRYETRRERRGEELRKEALRLTIKDEDRKQVQQKREKRDSYDEITSGSFLKRFRGRLSSFLSRSNALR